MDSKQACDDTLRSLQAAGRSFRFHSLAAAGAALGFAVDRLPLPLLLLLENLLRHRDDPRVEPAHLAAVARWPQSAGEPVPFFPARVLAPDSSGLPLLADLAALRAAAAARGLDPAAVNPGIPLDLVVDHAIAVEVAGRPDAAQENLSREIRRNAGRYRFLRWAEQAFANLRVVPPGQGILHQVNLEILTPLVVAGPQDRALCFPDSLIGCDSHTPMVNGLGVLGFGVGGIEALSALLGDPVLLPLPRVVGCRLSGAPRPGTLATDLALSLCATLARHRLDGACIQFFGPGLAALAATDRTTLANMAPEYGATMALFPQDAATLTFLRATGRPAALVALVEAYARAQGLWHDEAARPGFNEVVDFDLGAVQPVLAGPSLPSQRLGLDAVAATLAAKPTNGGEGLDHGSVVLAAITSCTNTANPAAMLAAGLLARNARRRGLATRPWVKASLSPGSRAVTGYLADFGLLEPLAELGFALAGYGCMTCVGGSGPLAPEVERAIRDRGLEVAALLSGNRNFAGRIHPLVRGSYLASPPLVVAYALAGTLALDLSRAALGRDRHGAPVSLAEIWPDPEELADLVRRALTPPRFRHVAATLQDAPPEWQALAAPAMPLFPFAPQDLELLEPPFFQARAEGLPDEIRGARALLLLGDQVNTDQISPAGSIPADSPAGRYLAARGVPTAELDRYITRRTNHEVMVRGTFASPRLANRLAGGREGGVTRHADAAALLPVYEAARRYAEEGRPLLVIAGENYGCGSSRDWAAKGTRLLGIRAVIAESFGAIHRSNLVGMGVLPLRFPAGLRAASLGLDGSEEFDLLELAENLAPGGQVTLCIRRPGAPPRLVPLVSALALAAEVDRLRQGGILPAVLARLAAAAHPDRDAAT